MGARQPKPPTYQQEEYANALVQRLREANNIEADAYARQVLHCKDRADMSYLIGKLVKLVEEVEEDPR